ncbi:MAG: hypothetical protein HFJ09_14435 [Lachnospiraceae bacterium]|nr:hypothetical protein [Lachnospiraceae bacterium]
MHWIILIGDENFNMSNIKSIKHYGCVECYDVTSIEGRYCVNFGEDHIFYDYDEAIDDYNEDELNKIPYSKPHFVTMTYTSKSCVRNVLQQDNFPTDIYIDNDCGLILPIEKFVQQGMPLDIDDMLKGKR